MKIENLKNSITLIGPSSVGKSFLSAELGKKLKMPHICIDDLIAIIRSEKCGNIGPTEQKKKQYINRCIEDIQNDHELSKLLKDKRYAQKEIQLVHDFIDLYDYYLKLFGSLKPFYELIEKYDLMVDLARVNQDYINSLAIVSAELLDKIFNIIDQPVIIDPPAPIGWNTEQIFVSSFSEMKLQSKNFKVDVEKCKKIINKILTNSSTVFLNPGIDYEQRNAAKYDMANNLILSKLGNYCEQAQIEVSVNGLFNEPKNHYLQRRSWFDAKEIAIKEKLKNKGEIANICDQIIHSITGLKEKTV